MTKLQITIVSLFSVLLANSCVAGGSNKLSSLYGIEVDKNRIHFEVISSGCTKADDFQVALNQSIVPVSLSIIRTRPDRCRGMPRRVSLTKTMDFSSVGSDLDVVLLNALKIIN